jgi:hypothetical protein
LLQAAAARSNPPNDNKRVMVMGTPRQCAGAVHRHTGTLHIIPVRLNKI